MLSCSGAGIKNDFVGLTLGLGVAKRSLTEGQRGKEMRTFLYLCLPFSKDRIEIIVFPIHQIGIFVNKQRFNFFVLLLF